LPQLHTRRRLRGAAPARHVNHLQALETAAIAVNCRQPPPGRTARRTWRRTRRTSGRERGRAAAGVAAGVGAAATRQPSGGGRRRRFFPFLGLCFQSPALRVLGPYTYTGCAQPLSVLHRQLGSLSPPGAWISVFVFPCWDARPPLLPTCYVKLASWPMCGVCSVSGHGLLCNDNRTSFPRKASTLSAHVQGCGSRRFIDIAAACFASSFEHEQPSRGW
jgi:hypothetical protein